MFDVCRNVLDKLFLSKLDSINGISVVAEQPFNNPIMLNILRPGVICQYYGMDRGVIHNHSIKRATYGFKSHVGTDPNKFITKPFDMNMKLMSNYLMNQLRLHDGGYYLKEMDLSIDFNSVVVLPYCSIMDVKINSTMGWHCDSSYNKDGSFKNISQVQNTPVVILTYGNNRTLKWQRVAHSSNGWVSDQTWTTQSMTMNDSSYMLLHPYDEKPHYNNLIGKKIRYQHGNVRMKKMIA